MTNKEELREKLLDISKRNSLCIRKQLSATEYQSEVWPLANDAIDELMHLIDEQTRAAYEQGYDDRTLEADHELEDAVRAVQISKDKDNHA